jgi:hypothetical protein
MSATEGEPAPERGGAYTYAGSITWEYSPELDHEPDPGEIVWTWVAFEEDDAIGKDRPVAVVGRAQDRRLVALMLSSRSHSGDRDWSSIGSGPWDAKGRESWVRKDRILAVHASAVRREGAILPRPAYDAIVQSLSGARSTGAKAGPRPEAARSSGVLVRLRRMFRR